MGEAFFTTVGLRGGNSVPEKLKHNSNKNVVVRAIAYLEVEKIPLNVEFDGGDTIGFVTGLSIQR